MKALRLMFGIAGLVTMMGVSRAFASEVLISADSFKQTHYREPFLSATDIHYDYLISPRSGMEEGGRGERRLDYEVKVCSAPVVATSTSTASNCIQELHYTIRVYKTTTLADLVTSWYWKYLHRAPEAGVVPWRVGLLMNNYPQTNMEWEIANSPEALAKR